MAKIKDLTGKIFDSGIEAISFVEIKNHAAYWRCKCHCGNEFIARGADLSNGHTKSCGCIGRKKMSELGKKNSHKIKDLTNQRFGLLTVLEITDKRDKGRCVIWKCKCDCGNIIELSSHVLVQGQKSCGCLKSKGELKVSELLYQNNIPFETQKIFSNCIFEDTKFPAKFDFFVDNSYIIEYDGIQHFDSNYGWNNNEIFQKTQKNDLVKNKWCKDNNIPLIRIPYTQYKDLCIEDLLLETSEFIV